MDPSNQSASASEPGVNGPSIDKFLCPASEPNT